MKILGETALHLRRERAGRHEVEHEIAGSPSCRGICEQTLNRAKGRDRGFPRAGWRAQHERAVVAQLSDAGRLRRPDKRSLIGKRRPRELCESVTGRPARREAEAVDLGP